MASKDKPRHARREVVVSVSPDCYSGKLLSLGTVMKAFAKEGVPLRQTDPPHGNLDWLGLRRPLPKHDYAWLWLNTAPYQPCGTSDGEISVKNLQIAYQTPAAVSHRIKLALDVLRRTETGNPQPAVTETQVESTFARQHFTLRSRTTALLSLLSGGELLAATGLPRSAALTVLVGREPGSIAMERGGWPLHERNFANLSVAYDLPPDLAARAETAIRQLRAALPRG